MKTHIPSCHKKEKKIRNKRNPHDLTKKRRKKNKIKYIKNWKGKKERQREEKNGNYIFIESWVFKCQFTAMFSPWPHSWPTYDIDAMERWMGRKTRVNLCSEHWLLRKVMECDILLGAETNIVAVPSAMECAQRIVLLLVVSCAQRGIDRRVPVINVSEVVI